MTGSLAEALGFNVLRNVFLFFEDSRKGVSESVVSWVTIFVTDPENRRDMFSSCTHENNLIHLYNEY